MPKKRSGTERMLVDDDIVSILTPNNITWLENESHLTKSDCKYPYQEPSINNLSNFNERQLIKLDIPEATVEYKEEVTPSDREKFFMEEK